MAVIAMSAGLLAAASLLSAPPALTAGPTPLSVEATVIERFEPSSETSRFGSLEFVGGFEFRSADSRLAGVSALRLLDNGSRFLAVTDKGHWFAGTLDRDAQGRPLGITEPAIGPLPGFGGAPLSGKGNADAESLSVDGNRILVGFERNHRILAYEAIDPPFASPPVELDLPLPREELRVNRGMETIATSPPDSPLGGASVAIAERSIDKAGNLFAAIFDGKANGVFTVRRDRQWDATDGAFLPNGDFLLLERRFLGILGGLGVRIRRISRNAFEPGALVDGEVIFEASLTQEIDNMEGLAVWTDADGATRLTLVSDNNGSLFQRNLLLEFRLAGDETAS